MNITVIGRGIKMGSSLSYKVFSLFIKKKDCDSSS